MSDRTEMPGKKAKQREVARARLLRSIPEHMREIMISEEPFVQSKGQIRSLFLHAARTLDERSFFIYSATSLRTKKSRMIIAEAAARADVSYAEAVKIRKRAIAVIRPFGKISQKYITSYDALGTTREELRGKGGYKRIVTERREQGIPDNVRDIYDAEKECVPENRNIRAIFLKAAKRLNAEEFEIFVKARVRRPEFQIGVEQIAAEKGRPLNDVIKIFDAAAFKMQAAFAVINKRTAQLPIFQPSAPRPQAE